MLFPFLKNKLYSGKGPWKGTINLAGREVPYTLRVSTRARHLRLQVGAGTGLEVITPERLAPGRVESVLREKQKWILGKLDDLARQAENRGLFDQQGGGKVLYRGREYEVEARVEAGSSPGVVVGQNKLVVTVPEGQGGAVERQLEHWLRGMARVVINNRLRELNRNLNLSYNRVFIRDQKTRWGSCSNKNNLNFNWRLVMAPPRVLDYVIVHELMHLVEPNHSKKFWALVEKECPDYKSHRAWLRKNGRQLSLFG